MFTDCKSSHFSPEPLELLRHNVYINVPALMLDSLYFINGKDAYITLVLYFHIVLPVNNFKCMKCIHALLIVPTSQFPVV